MHITTTAYVSTPFKQVNQVNTDGNFSRSFAHFSIGDAPPMDHTKTYTYEEWQPLQAKRLEQFTVHISPFADETFRKFAENIQVGPPATREGYEQYLDHKKRISDFWETLDKFAPSEARRLRNATPTPLVSKPVKMAIYAGDALVAYVSHSIVVATGFITADGMEAFVEHKWEDVTLEQLKSEFEDFLNERTDHDYRIVTEQQGLDLNTAEAIDKLWYPELDPAPNVTN
ncbi:hypothetical protein SAMN04488118_102472 [Epibacterium ulvae]|uniref:Uncharacterized protein n=1 Tax=Epibacterium ulvae TaxID=1156985 RepID=A0A1G5Q302_9RHOB|nr:hypothetical protein [Epibacterium ulvae]SCZ55771.1 hypothetical protein SAMN04488118_102472 [Epibacterium ulvae]